MIAALYVETDGVYYGLPDVDPWDEQRDARLYDGPWPVVAHPPCQRWCRFAKQVEKKHGYKVGDDGGCFEMALLDVRRFGGVLEHRAASLAWDHFGLPKPTSSQGWTHSMFEDGASCYVEQGRYGLPMRKQTWLYAVGVELPTLRWGRRIDSEGGDYKWGSYLYKGAPNKDRPRLPASILSQTPTAFRDALLNMGPKRTSGCGGVTVAHQPGHMVTGQKHNRLNGHCPDLARCSLLPFACSSLCWRMEGDLIEAARVAGMTAARAGKNTE